MGIIFYLFCLIIIILYIFIIQNTYTKPYYVVAVIMFLVEQHFHVATAAILL